MFNLHAGTDHGSRCEGHRHAVVIVGGNGATVIARRVVGIATDAECLVALNGKFDAKFLEFIVERRVLLV